MARIVLTPGNLHDTSSASLYAAFQQLNSMLEELYNNTALEEYAIINLIEGTTTITTTLTSIPKNIQFLDSDGKLLNAGLGIKMYLSGGFCKIDVYSGEAVNNVTYKI